MWFSQNCLHLTKITSSILDPRIRVRPEEGLKKRNRIPDFECIDSVSYHRNRIFKKVFPVPVRPEPEFGKPVPDPVIPDIEDKPDFRLDNIFFKIFPF